MILNISSGGATGSERTMHSGYTEYSHVSASPSKAAKFADRVARLEEKALRPDADMQDASADKPAPGKHKHRPQQDDIAIAADTTLVPQTANPIGPIPIPIPAAQSGSGANNVEAAANRPAGGIEIAASTSKAGSIPTRTPLPSELGGDANDAEPAWNNQTGKMEIAASTSKAGNVPTPLPGEPGYDANNAEPAWNNQTGKIEIAASTSKAGSVPTHTPLSGDMQSLLGEFETAVRHFENAGNQWVGSARITFRSNVLSGASIQITGDGKSIDILIAQAASSPMTASLSRQEKQLGSELARRLGRTVNLHITHVSSEQAANDAEPQ